MDGVFLGKGSQGDFQEDSGFRPVAVARVEEM